jgi:hypothetical protein
MAWRPNGCRPCGCSQDRVAVGRDQKLEAPGDTDADPVGQNANHECLKGARAGQIKDLGVSGRHRSYCRPGTEPRPGSVVHLPKPICKACTELAHGSTVCETAK